MATMSSAAVEVISKETIKPSTATPYQLRSFNLSLLDQHVPVFYVPTLLFYPAAAANSSKRRDDLDLLKSSLSETLSHFYPLAGRLKDNIVVDCNDQGIDFLEAKIKGNMCDFVTKPDAPLSLLLPSEVHVSNNFVKEAQVIVQVNMFDCGGTAICLCISHKIADACTMSTFIRNWAATTKTARCRDANIAAPTTVPSFDSASLFPPSEQLISPSGMPPALSFLIELVSRRDYKAVSKRFVLDMVKITSVCENLQGWMHDNFKCRRPTRVEVVSALIWKAVMKSAPAGSLSTVTHSVNFRSKMDPPLQDASFGNLWVSATAVLEATTPATTSATSTSNEVQVLLQELSHFVAQLRGEINKVKGDKGCMEKVVHDFCASKGKNKGEAIALSMTSWCKMGLYEADFGWGKPVWATLGPDCTGTMKNFIFLNDTKCGDGIEVLARFLEDDMAKFELHLTEILELI